LDKELLRRFLNNTTTVEENKALLQYFSTAEGKDKLKNFIDEVAREEFSSQKVDIQTSERIFKKLAESIHKRRTLQQPHIPFYNNKYLRIAASVLLFVVASTLLYTSRKDISNLLFPVIYADILSPKGYQTEVILSDGTVVKLNENSRIKYAKDFGRNNTREIILKGEAYFDVKRDPSKPFIISTAKAQIKVLGTSFNVKEKSYDSSVTVVVTHGVVAVKAPNNANSSAIRLRAGDVGVLSSTKITVHESYQVNNFLCWSTGKIEYREVPLSNVVEELSLIYGTKLILNDSAIKNLPLTATLKYQSLPYVVSEICAFMGLQYKKENQNYILSKRQYSKH
jgi:ferric-dicitrate binding protein FerR (iron transport regulator)